MARLVQNIGFIPRHLTNSKAINDFSVWKRYFRHCTNRLHSIFSTSIPEFENRPGINSYEDLHRFSREQNELFWSILARSRLKWYRDFDVVKDCNLDEGKISWFLNGKINASGEDPNIYIYIFFFFTLKICPITVFRFTKSAAVTSQSVH